MADYGLKIWNASGVLTLDTTDTLGRLRYSVEVAQDTTGNTTLSDISGKTTAQFAIDLSGNLDGEYYPHVVTRSGTTITWTKRTGGGSGDDSLILVFIYD